MLNRLVGRARRAVVAARGVARRLAREPAPADAAPSLANHGYCECCRATVQFRVLGPWLRDQYRCPGCNSMPRQRHLCHILNAYFPEWERATIHESSPDNDFIARRAPGYSASFFHEGVALGSMHEGHRCENLERLTFADESFDLFVTQDVLEHVFDPAAALREVMRVLKPGGAHVFTVPKNPGLRTGYQRASLLEGLVAHLREPVFHGSPIGDGRSLVTWDYGDDFECVASTWAGHPLTTYVTRDRHLGLDGQYLEVFVMRKCPPSPN